MRKYGGHVVHQTRDGFGILEVVDTPFERSLHFGNAAKQSSTDPANPLRLVLTYTRAMALSLLFNPEPRRVLLIGLGGGSLAKFLLQHYPGCHIDAVEIRREVFRLATAYFGLPDDPRLTLFIEDGAAFVRGASPEFGDYDLILADAFLDQGIAHSVCSVSFFEGCRMRLSRRGVLAMNLWSGDTIRAPELLAGMADCFGHALRLPVEGKDNIIGLAGPAVPPSRELKRFAPLARELGEALDVEFPALLKKLRRHNSAFWR